MVYTAYDRLNVIRREGEIESCPLAKLKEKILANPTNVVYFENRWGGVLYGIVSTGDLYRSEKNGQSMVKVNRNFTAVFAKEYMRARALFREKENINNIPVIDKEGKLLGEYSRCDDLIRLTYEEPPGNTQGEIDYWKMQRHVALVKPCPGCAEKLAILQKWEERLRQMNVPVEVIDRADIVDRIDKVDLFLVADMDEKRAIRTCLREQFTGVRTSILAYAEIRENVLYYESMKTVDKFLQSLRQTGVWVCNLIFAEDGSGYYERMVNTELPRKLVRDSEETESGRLETIMREFYGELYDEESYGGFLRENFRIRNDGMVNRLKDVSGKYLNVRNGERLTVDQPKDFERTIYFFGPCLIAGNYVEDRHTIESFLQKKCNDHGVAARVVNLGCWDSAPGTMGRIMQTPLQKNDIVVIFLTTETQPVGVINLNLIEILEQENAPAEWFYDKLWHCNHRANALYADAIYQTLRPILEEKSAACGESGQINIDMSILIDTYIEKYFSGFDPSAYRKTGSIVMNCNPFTYGHRYLIEEALKRVDFLIVFVVEEDKSLFTFAERFAFVKAGTADLSRVMVVPSGQFILSQTTFPEYFIKVADEDIIQNVERDITIFAEQIAPRLHITCRFVGEEPEDEVTNEYNLAMKRILPEHGISVVEIPRKRNGKSIISASKVRRSLEENPFMDPDGSVPEPIKPILFWGMSEEEYEKNAKAAGG